VIVRARSGQVVATVRLDEITRVSRGGRDLVITRREADPLAITAATLDGARQFDAALRELLPGNHDCGRRRWDWSRD
jgi:hypothetical protein